MTDKPYILICELSLNDMEESVKHWMEKGYIPTGGVAVHVHDKPCSDLYIYHQAMIKNPKG